MKIVIALVCLAACVAALPLDSNGCDPDAEGVPNCTSDAEGSLFRNNWDPTHYFVCQNGKPVQNQCESGGYNPVTQECVPWSTWQWTPPCPVNQ